LIVKSSKTVVCARCGLGHWCSKLCQSQSLSEHVDLCPEPPPYDTFKVALHPSLSLSELASRVRVELRPVHQRTSLVSKKYYQPGECILVEDPTLAVPSVHIAPLVAQSLARKLSLKHLEIEGVPIRNPVSIQDQARKELVQLALHYKVPYQPHVVGRVNLLCQYAVLVISPLSGRPLGRALYTYSSHMTHHCRPNTCRVMDGRYRSMVYCVEPIQPGDELTCNHSLPETSLLPVSARYNWVKNSISRLCECSACEAETEVLRQNPALVSAFPKRETGGQQQQRVLFPHLIADPRLGMTVPRTSENILLMDTDLELDSTELLYVCVEQDYALNQMGTAYCGLSDFVRGRVISTPAIMTDSHTARSTYEFIDRQVSGLIKLLNAQTGTGPIDPRLLVETFSLMRWLASGQWAQLILPLRTLYLVLLDIVKPIVLSLAGPNHMEMHITGALELWIRTWSTLVQMATLIPGLRVVVELLAEMPLDFLDDGLKAGGTFVAYIRQVLVSELQLNRSVGVFSGWVEMARDLGIGSHV
jgi:hypothetical protein